MTLAKFRTPTAVLIAELDGYLSALYSPEQNHLLSAEVLLQPEVTFVVARAEGSVLGCGAIVRCGREYIEVKRMFVRPGNRGRRIGERILRHLRARDLRFRHECHVSPPAARPGAQV